MDPQLIMAAVMTAFDGRVLGPRVALVVTFSPSLLPLTADLQQLANAAGRPVRITPALAEDGLAARLTRQAPPAPKATPGPWRDVTSTGLS